MGRLPRWAELPAFAPRSRARMVKTLPAVLGVGAVYFTKFEIVRTELRHVAPLTEVDLAEFKFAQNYATGGVAGYLASHYSANQAKSWHADFLFADLFASWSSFLIAADAAMDSKSMDASKSRRFLSRLFLELFPEYNRAIVIGEAEIIRHFEAVFERPFPTSAPHSFPETLHFRLELFALHMAKRFARTVCRLYEWHARHGLGAPFSVGMRDFYINAADLAAGQLQSVQQCEVDDNHDWGWYRDLIELKTTNILFAILHLFVQRRNGEMTGQAMARRFIALNSLFFHRQVLDDLLDFDEDLGRGLANSLTYMLISQARIAVRATLPIECEPALRAEIVRASMVWSDIDVQTCPIESAIREALANTVEDRQLSLSALVEVSQRRGTALKEAWARLDYSAVAQIVADSSIANRILSWVESGQVKHAVNAELALIQEEPMQDVLYYAFERTVRTYEKCVARWKRTLPVASSRVSEPLHA